MFNRIIIPTWLADGSEKSNCSRRQDASVEGAGVFDGCSNALQTNHPWVEEVNMWVRNVWRADVKLLPVTLGVSGNFSSGRLTVSCDLQTPHPRAGVGRPSDQGDVCPVGVEPRLARGGGLATAIEHEVSGPAQGS